MAYSFYEVLIMLNKHELLSTNDYQKIFLLKEYLDTIYKNLCSVIDNANLEDEQLTKMNISILNGRKTARKWSNVQEIEALAQKKGKSIKLKEELKYMTPAQAVKKGLLSKKDIEMFELNGFITRKAASLNIKSIMQPSDNYAPMLTIWLNNLQNELL